MLFSPQVNDAIIIDGARYRFSEHPAAPGSDIPYGQEGRAGVVFQLVDDQGARRALKVFKPRFRQPSLVGLTRKLETYARLPGLTVCRRRVLTPQNHSDLLRQQPDLLFAASMPWIAGQTWNEIIQRKEGLTAAQSLGLAHALLDVLGQMEQEGVAHGDLSGANLLIDGLTAGAPRVEWVDVEQFYAPELLRPKALPSSSPGYAHQTAADGLWEAEMDRFAGAVLLAEILGWEDGGIRNAADGETYFAENEMQKDVDRYWLLRGTLAERWGERVAELFEQAWGSDSAASCPSFGAWQIALPHEAPAARPSTSIAPPVPLSDVAAPEAIAAEEDVLEKLAGYRSLLQEAEPDSSLAQELTLILDELESKAARAGTEDLTAPAIPILVKSEPAEEMAVQVPAETEPVKKRNEPPQAAVRERPFLPWLGLGLVAALISIGLGASTLMWNRAGKEATPAVVKVGFIDSPVYARAVAIDGDYAYVPDGSHGLRIINVADPAAPTRANLFDTLGFAYDVAVAGNYAYIADGAQGLRLVNVTATGAPVSAGGLGFNTSGSARRVTVAGEYAYVTGGTRWLQIVNVADPSTPTDAGRIETLGSAWGVAVAGEYAYIANGKQGLRIIHVADPGTPTDAGSIDTPGDAVAVAVVGDYAYVADRWEGLRIIDISDPAAPVEVAFYDTPGDAQAVALADDFAYVADTAGGLRIINVANPRSPFEAGSYSTQGWVQGVAVDGNYVYTVNGAGGMYILNVASVTGVTAVGQAPAKGEG